jgi:WD40 repeat protein/class 3 adenylate cyclase
MDPELASQHRAQVEEFRRKHRTGLLTLVFTDIVGSTALKQGLGEREVASLFQDYRGLVRSQRTRFPESEEIETAGDSFLLVFARPSEAVEFALVVQTELESWSQARGIALRQRVGIHLGEVVIEEHQGTGKAKDLYGGQLDVCARVMALAGANQILMTRAVFDNARRVLKGEDVPEVGPLKWLNHGPYQFKGLEEPIEVCEVRAGIDGPVTPPTNTDKAQRVAAEGELVLGWRPAIGQEVSNTQWVLEEKLGEGGFGEVWKAHHEKLDEQRVFKFCFRADRVRSLKREVTLFRLLKERIGEHPNIVRLHDIYFDQPPFYLEEEYVSGKDLKSWCEAQGGVEKVPLEVRLEIVAQAADGLQAAHDAGVIHRDVKPGNILIAERGMRNAELQWLGQSSSSSSSLSSSENPKSEDPQLSTINHQPSAKLTDFGIGQVLSEEYLSGITRAGFTQTMMGPGSSSQTGTQMYMAPELFAGKLASIRSDIYSLGVVLYQVLVSDFTRPVTTDWVRDIDDTLLREDLQMCFAGNPEERFAGAVQLARHLRALPERRAAVERQKAELAVREQVAYRRGLIRSASVAFAIVTVLAALVTVALYQSRRAAAGELRARQSSYAAGMLLAARELEADDLGTAFGLLKKQVPRPGETDLRGWEWRQLWARCRGDELFTLGTHDYEVVAVAFLPDGRLLSGGLRLPYAAAQPVVKLWDPAARRLLATDSSCSEVSAFAVTSDGKLIAVADWGPRVELLDGNSLSSRGSLVNSNGVRYVAFSPDGKYLAAGGDQVDLWDVATLGHLARIAGFGAVAFSPDGQTLAFSDADQHGVVLWSVARKTVITTFPRTLASSCLAFSPDGLLLAAGDWQGRAFLINIKSGQATLLINQAVPVRAVAFSPDGTILATSGHDQVIRLWDVAQQKERITLKGHLGLIASVAFSPDGRFLASGSKDGTIRAWDPHSVARNFVITNFPFAAFEFAVCRNGKYLATPTTNGYAQVWNLETLRETSRFPTLEAVPFNAVCPNGQFVATADTNGDVIVWDARNGGKTTRFPAQGGPVPLVEFSADGRFCASAGHDRTLRVWEVATRQMTAVIQDDAIERLFDLILTKNGNRLFTVGDKGIGIWDVARQKRIVHYHPHKAGIKRIALSPDERTFATASADETVALWDVETRNRLAIFEGGATGGFLGVAFSPDGKRLAAGTDAGRIHMWDVTSQQQVGSFLFPHPYASLVRFSPDGRLLMTAEGEGGAYVGLVLASSPSLREIEARTQGH